MSSARLTDQEFNHYYSYCLDPYAVLYIARCCIINPNRANVDLINSPQEQGLRDFAIKALGAIVKIHLRRRGNGILVSDKTFNEMSRDFQRSFFTIQRARDGIKASDGEINAARDHVLYRRPFPSVKTLIKIIDAYFINSYNRENPAYIREIANAWRTYVNSDSPFARECRAAGYGSTMLQYARQGYLEETFSWQNGTINWSNLRQVFQIQAKIALERGIRNYGSIRRKTEAIIKAYQPIMRPEFVYYQKQAKEVIQLKREEFYRRLKRSYLNTIARVAASTTLPPLSRFHSKTLDAMKSRGSFGQATDENDVFGLSVEHVVPLSAGDNFYQNFSIESNIVNFDMNTLVWLQTSALGAKPDILSRRKNGISFVERSGDAWPIIVLRPIGTLPNGLTSPLILGEGDTHIDASGKHTVKSISKKIIHAPIRPKAVQLSVRSGKIPSNKIR